MRLQVRKIQKIACSWLFVAHKEDNLAEIEQLYDYGDYCACFEAFELACYSKTKADGKNLDH